MSDAASQSNYPDLWPIYEEERAALLTQRATVVCALCVIFVPMGFFLDRFAYPNLTSVFGLIRGACEGLMLTFLLLLIAPTGKRLGPLLGLFWTVPMVLYVSMMIAISDGIMSPYYIGIAMVVITGCLILPWTFSETLSVTVFTSVTYVWACYYSWGHSGSTFEEGQLRLAVTNGFLMAIIMMICPISSFFTSRLRFHDFRLQYELDLSKKELQESYCQLEELDRAKSRFFANISHELRTPLTLIISPIEKLQGVLQRSDDSGAKDALRLMHGNAMRLLSLINDLLDLVRLEDGKLKLRREPIDLASFLPGLVSEVAEFAKENNLSIHYEGDDSGGHTVFADRSQLEKVFLNLLFNAIKFTPEGGSIRIRSRRDGDRIVASVSDTGVGISEVDSKAVFTRFWQDDSAGSRVKQGTGIGLALVREIVELHGGEVGVDSVVGEGTSFTVKLEACRADTPSTPISEKNEPWLEELYRKAKVSEGAIRKSIVEVEKIAGDDLSKHTILVVEDEADMRDFLRLELEGNYNVIIAGDGRQGFELATKVRPDLILTDMMLPEMDGVTLCSKIKSSPTPLPTKIVLLTAKADEKTKIDALKAGADDFLTKPFSSLELRTRLANILLNARLERQLQTQNITLQTTLDKLRETEAQLIQTERLSALGNLSAGIMHEINNPINFMLTAIHVLRQILDKPSEEVKETVDDIDDGLKRIRDIIADLRGFAYDAGPSKKNLCVPADVVSPVRRLLAGQIPEDVNLSEDIEENSQFLGNPSQITQLILNLLQNAIHATENNHRFGKKREISLTMREIDTGYLIAVRDNGKGISTENRKKVFDPFFSTKDVGKGMGLGLSICHTIVKNHQGKLTVDSQPGIFTEFRVELVPIAEDVSKIA